MHMMEAIAIGLDCISIGIVVKLIAISSDPVSMIILSNQLRSAWIVYQWMSMVVFDGGFDGRFGGGFDGQFHLAVLGY
jgi:hypothetical protein